jgi:hypothetical protein
VHGAQHAAVEVLDGAGGGARQRDRAGLQVEQARDQFVALEPRQQLSTRWRRQRLDRQFDGAAARPASGAPRRR